MVLIQFRDSWKYHYVDIHAVVAHGSRFGNGLAAAKAIDMSFTSMEMEHWIGCRKV